MTPAIPYLYLPMLPEAVYVSAPETAKHVWIWVLTNPSDLDSGLWVCAWHREIVHATGSWTG